MTRALSLVLLLALACCAKREPPLPGDSISADGGVQLTPKTFTTIPETPLGAIESKLFSPDFVMEHQGAIHLEGTQRDAILRETQQGQAELTKLQWDLQAEKEKLVTILDADKVDEVGAKTQASRVMDQENKIKSAHLSMLVRIKNLLSSEQQKKLRELRGR